MLAEINGGVTIDLTQVLTQLLVTVLSICGLMLANYLRNKAKAAAAEAQKNGLDAQTAVQKQIEAYLLDAAASIAEERFGNLAERVLNGEFKTPAEVKQVLYGWGDDLKKRVIDSFGQKDIDVVKLLGEPLLEQMIDRASSSVAPFPGRETSSAMMNPDTATAVKRLGVRVVRDAFLNTLNAPAPVLQQTLGL